jgi:hypothetical protein
VRQASPQASERRLSAVGRAGSSLSSASAEKRLRRPLGAILVERIRELIRDHPTFGYRKLWALPGTARACSST